ncbi:ArdC-like ssDNA-binding domain-containing protein [Dietzia sp. 179-F 9C3 NHS]|uniref:ArdC-like ssDNA-binding domain-containing protein n=1 Tax=Dietzia sp. 179-F 9C3 NHS TaxID=3374295 RepID=UPI00387975BC
MCLSSKEPNGPKQCPSHARAAQDSAAQQVAVLEKDYDDTVTQLQAQIPDSPTVEQLVALYPENEDFIRHMQEQGESVGLHPEWTDEDGRPLLMVGKSQDEDAAPAPGAETPIDTTTPMKPEERPVSFADMDRKERAEAIRAEIDDAIAELGTADGWQKFMDFRSQFTSYSLTNVLLIQAQYPNATMVGGAKSRWNSLGRNIRKGEKAIWINAPCTRRIKETDPDTGQEKTVTRTTGFKPVPVFDVSQTEGDPLPEQPTYTTTALSPGQAPPGMKEGLESDLKAKGYTVSYENTGDKGGWVDFRAKQVVIDSRANDREQAVTLAHELAHVELGHGEKVNQYHLGKGGKRGDMEVEAESTAYVIGRHYGMRDHSSRSFSYIDGWAKGDKEKVRRSAEAVVGATSRILDRLGKFQ